MEDLLELSSNYKKLREEINQLVKLDNKIIDVVNYIETKFSEKDKIKLAFPVGININDIVAHYSPDYDYNGTFTNGDLIKIDFGLHSNGKIIDSSRSYFIGDEDSIESKMIDCAKEACTEAIKQIKNDSYIPDISNIIEEIINSYNYCSLGDLCGHQIDLYKVHGKLVIPNIECEEILPNNMKRIKPNYLYAVEPFVSNAETKLYGDLDNISHYMFNYHRYDESNLEYLPYIQDNYKTLCFDIKWLKKTLDKDKISSIINNNFITPYPTLRCMNSAGVIKTAHHEETIYVTDTNTIILS